MQDNNSHNGENESDRIKHIIIRYILLAGVFAFSVWGITCLNTDPELVFDKFMAAGMLLFLFFFYRKMGLTIPVLSIAAFAMTLHQLKLYGNVYYGIQFDMIMHFTGGLAVSLIAFSFLYALNGMGYSNRAIVVVLAIVLACGMGTFIEITEYFGYAHLGTGEGILRFGAGDEGEWNDAIWDMVCNTLGAITGATVMALFSRRKNSKLNKLKSFLGSVRTY